MANFSSSSKPMRMTSGALAPGVAPIQGRRGHTVALGHGDALAQSYKCTTCAITYEVVTGQAKTCPMCQLRSDLQSVRAEAMRLQQEYERLEGEYLDGRRQLDTLLAMRETFELLDDNDRAFVKSVLYVWRQDRNVTLQLTHRISPQQLKDGRRKKKYEAPVSGFLAMYRFAQAEEHVCTSVGGVALANYFDEAVRTMTHPRAMDMMLRAMNQHLSGAS